jgi:hypothetical protein
MFIHLHHTEAGSESPPSSLGPDSPQFQLWKVSELPAVWAREPDRRQLAEAADVMGVPIDALQCHTFVELPDCPWGRAYHRWATAELDRLPAATAAAPPTYLPVLLSNLGDFREGGRSEAVVLRSLLDSGKPPPYFGRTFAPAPAGWRGGVRA